jgi:hypothetical protein
MKKNISSTFAKIIIILCFLISTQTYAATIYINSTTGDDTTGDGTVESPYATFSKGYTEANASGDILDLSGTFDWSDTDEDGDVADDGFIIEKDITIQGQSAATTFIQASSTVYTADSSVFTIHADATVVIKNVTIRNGFAQYGLGGGAISNRGNLTIEHVVIRDNVFNSATYGGAGGIYSGTSGSDATYLTIATSTIYDNTFTGTLYGAGAVFMESNNGVLNIFDTTIATNTADSTMADFFPFSYAEPAGAIGARVATVYITNSTIYGNNTNAYAGALNIQLGETTITNSTIVGNNADLGAGGIMVDEVDLYMMNTLVANNTADSQPNDFHALDQNSTDEIVDNGYNIVEYSTNKTWSGTGNITGNQTSLNVDTSLNTNGASTGIQTLALLYGSVAINAGTSTANNGIGPLLFDQRGVARNGLIDIGAFESYAVAPDPEPEVTPVVVVQTGGGWVGSIGGGGSTTAIPLSLQMGNITQTATTTATSTTLLFTKNLSFGMADVEVKMLQKFLNDKGFIVAISGPGSKGNETTKFGAATRAALIKFQKANNIKPAIGYFGPVTRGIVLKK